MSLHKYFSAYKHNKHYQLISGGKVFYRGKFIKCFSCCEICSLFTASFTHALGTSDCVTSSIHQTANLRSYSKARVGIVLYVCADYLYYTTLVCLLFSTAIPTSLFN